MTPLEREVQGWLKSHPASPKVPVALRSSLNEGLLVPNLFLRIDITATGGVTHLGRTTVGQLVEVSRRDLQDPESTPRIQFLSFDVEDAEVAFRLLVTGRVGWTGVHVHLLRGARPEAEDLINGLAEIVDFGPDFERLRSLRSDLASLGKRVEVTRTELANASSARERLSAAEELAEVLRELAGSQRMRAEILGVESSLGTELAAELARIDSSVPQLIQLVVAEIEAEWHDQQELLGSAEAAFRTRSLKIGGQLDAARSLDSLARAALANIEELAMRRPDRSALTTLEAFTSALEVWREGAERARDRGCPWEEPLSETKIQSLLEIPAPDPAIAGEVRRCGVSFLPEAALLDQFELRGMGRSARAALQEGTAFRLSREMVPSLGSALAKREAEHASSRAALGDDEAPARGVKDESEPSGGIPGTGSEMGRASPPRDESERRSRREPRNTVGTPPLEAASWSEPCRVHFRVSPLDTSVYVDGKFLGTGEEVSRLRTGLLFDPGKHEIEFVRPGYTSQERRLELASGEVVTLRVRLVE